MFFCKYKIYHIKKSKTIYKKHKLKIIGFFLLIIFSVTIFFVENNIQSIISNKFSENKSFNLSIEDVDFNFNGNFTLRNFLVLNKNGDSLIYSSKLSVDPISLTKAIYDKNYEFRKINFNDGFIDIKFFSNSNFSNNASFKVNDSLMPFSSSAFIENLEFQKFKIKNNQEIIVNSLDFNIDEIKFSKNNIDLIIDDLNFKYKEYLISKLYSQISVKDQTLYFKEFNININNSFLKGAFRVINPLKYKV